MDVKTDKFGTQLRHFSASSITPFWVIQKMPRFNPQFPFESYIFRPNSKYFE